MQNFLFSGIWLILFNLILCQKLMAGGNEDNRLLLAVSARQNISSIEVSRLSSQDQMLLEQAKKDLIQLTRLLSENLAYLEFDLKFTDCVRAISWARTVATSLNTMPISLDCKQNVLKGLFKKSKVRKPRETIYSYYITGVLETFNELINLGMFIGQLTTDGRVCMTIGLKDYTHLKIQ